MKRSTARYFIVCLILIVTLSACTQPVSDNLKEMIDGDVPVVEETLVEEPQDIEPENEELVFKDEDARMRALISEKIEDCHMLDFILRQNKTKEEWSTTIDRMIGKGANINPEEKEMIIDWLISRNE